MRAGYNSLYFQELRAVAMQTDQKNVLRGGGILRLGGLRRAIRWSDEMRVLMKIFVSIKRVSFKKNGKDNGKVQKQSLKPCVGS